MIRRYLVLFVIITFISCGNKNKIPDGILKPGKMQAVLWDVIRVNAFTTEFIKKDSSKNTEEENIKLQQKVFATHKVSREDFYKSYDYYKANTVLMKEMMDSMITKAERERNKNLDTLPTAK